MEKIEKVFKGECVPICFAANSDFIPYTAVMIQSIIDQRSPENNYDIIILYTDVKGHLIKKTVELCTGISNVSVRFVDISDYVKSVNLFTESVYTPTTYSPEAYYRLLIPSLMPDYDKVLYFDGDMLALSDVAELYHTTDMTGYMLASSRDYAGICNCYIEGDGRREYREKVLGLKNIDNYIISGMLVFNVSEFNRKYTAEELMRICASRNWRQHDQDVLNVICEDSLLLVDGAWDYLEPSGTNHQYLPKWLWDEFERSLENIKIIHFAGSRKPWRCNNALYSDEFWLTCKKTPFFDDIIKGIKANWGYKNSILELVTGQPSKLNFAEEDAYITNGEFFIARMSDIYTKIEYFTYKKGILTVDGYTNFAAVSEQEPIRVYLSVDRQLHECKITERRVSEYRFGRLLYRGVPFHIELAISAERAHTIKVVSKLRGENFIVSRSLRFGALCAINEQKCKYYFANGTIFTTDKSNIYMKPAGKLARIKHELAYLKTLKHKKDGVKRIAYFLYRFFGGSGIWIFADRYNAAGDNAEALFRYVTENKPKGVKPYFAISESSADAERLKKIGRVLILESRKFRFLRLFADVFLSSHCDTEAFLDYNKAVFSDILMYQKTVFLQHGIIKDDLSAIYSKYTRNFDIFITSAKREYDSIAYNDNYGMGERGTRLTGLARYDLLEDRRERVISVLPTWRQYCMFLSRGKWVIRDGFEHTEYYKFYTALLTDRRLLSAAREHGYKIEFVPHKLMEPVLSYFKDSDVVTVVKDCNYSELFSKTALLFTDFSSTAFDAAYLKKPIIYAHFDKEKFFGTQYAEGYFDYERDGFGEVVYDIDSAVELLVEYIKSGCSLKDKYRSRTESFYAYTDKHNRKRILDEVLKLL